MSLVRRRLFLNLQNASPTASILLALNASKPRPAHLSLLPKNENCHPTGHRPTIKHHKQQSRSLPISPGSSLKPRTRSHLPTSSSSPGQVLKASHMAHLPPHPPKTSASPLRHPATSTPSSTQSKTSLLPKSQEMRSLPAQPTRTNRSSSGRRGRSRKPRDSGS